MEAENEKRRLDKEEPFEAEEKMRASAQADLEEKNWTKWKKLVKKWYIALGILSLISFATADPATDLPAIWAITCCVWFFVPIYFAAKRPEKSVFYNVKSIYASKGRAMTYAKLIGIGFLIVLGGSVVGQII